MPESCTAYCYNTHIVFTAAVVNPYPILYMWTLNAILIFTDSLQLFIATNPSTWLLIASEVNGVNNHFVT